MLAATRLCSISLVSNGTEILETGERANRSQRALGVKGRELLRKNQLLAKDEEEGAQQAPR